MRFFECKVCIEKDKRIEDLQKQIILLQSIAYPQTLTNHQAFINSIEVNKLMDGGVMSQVELDSSVSTPEAFDIHWD